MVDKRKTVVGRLLFKPLFEPAMLCDKNGTPLKLIALMDRTGQMEKTFSLDFFEDISCIMAKHADPQKVPDTLDEFNIFSIYQVLPEIIDLWGLNVETQVEAKKLRSTDWEMTTLLLLRCVQIGISIRDLALLTIREILDMYSEMQNDDFDYPLVATQEMRDRF